MKRRNVLCPVLEDITAVAMAAPADIGAVLVDFMADPALAVILAPAPDPTPADGA